MAAVAKTKRNSDFEDISIDVLQHVLGFLDGRNRLSASQVSKKWFWVVNQKKLLRDICVVFDGERLRDGMVLFSKMTRKFRRFLFRCCIVDRSVLLFLEKYKDRVSNLAFEHCDFNSLDSFPHLAELESFRVSSCFSFDFVSIEQSLNKLKTLKILDTVLSHSQFVQLCERMPNLREIVFPGCDLGTPEHRNINNYTELETVFSCISMRSTSLKTLSLRVRFAEDPLVPSIARFPGLDLTKLTLIYNGDYGPVIQKLLTQQPNIISLDLKLESLDDNDVSNICDLLPNLKELKLKSSFELTDVAIERLFQLRQLNKLGLCGFLQLPNLDQNLKLSRQNLASLDLTQVSLDDRHVLKLCDHFPDLRELFLDDCFKITDVSVARIFQLKNLRRLSLNSCRRISERALTVAVQNSRCHLREFDVKCCHVGDDFVDVVCSRYLDIRVLAITGCGKTTIRSLRRLVNAKIENRDLVR